MIKPVRLIVLCLMLSAVSSTDCLSEDSGGSINDSGRRQLFETKCPKPGWWDDEPAPDIGIHTYDELIKWVQDKRRSPRQFFKAAYEAVVAYPMDPDIAVNAINFMHYTKDYPHRIELQEYAVENYFSYKGIYGEPGDTMAGIVRNLAQLYNAAARYDKTIRLIERLLEEREGEIMDHLLELLHLPYAEALHGRDRDEEALSVLNRAVSKYNGAWEESLREMILLYEGRLTGTE